VIRRSVQTSLARIPVPYIDSTISRNMRAGSIASITRRTSSADSTVGTRTERRERCKRNFPR